VAKPPPRQSAVRNFQIIAGVATPPRPKQKSNALPDLMPGAAIGSANAYRLFPAEIATNCAPLDAVAPGDARLGRLDWNAKGPVGCESRPSRLPSAVQRKQPHRGSQQLEGQCQMRHGTSKACARQDIERRRRALVP